MNIFKKNKIRTVLDDDLVVYSPVEKGKALKLSTLRDGVFSLKGVGDGITIDSKDEKLDIFAPVDGEIQVLYHYGNCIGIRTSHGAKILIHIGTESQHLKERYSDFYVKQGDQVKVGQKLATVNLKYMKENGTMTSLEQVIVVVPTGHEVINKYKGKLSKTTTIFAVRKRK